MLHFFKHNKKIEGNNVTVTNTVLSAESDAVICHNCHYFNCNNCNCNGNSVWCVNNFHNK